MRHAQYNDLQVIDRRDLRNLLDIFDIKTGEFYKKLGLDSSTISNISQWLINWEKEPLEILCNTILNNQDLFDNTSKLINCLLNGDYDQFISDYFNGEDAVYIPLMNKWIIANSKARIKICQLTSPKAFNRYLQLEENRNYLMGLLRTISKLPKIVADIDVYITALEKMNV